MEDKIIIHLANKITTRLKDKLNIETEMKKFLDSQISTENKLKVLEQLYLFQLYSNAYTGPDPRGKKNIWVNAIVMLNERDEKK